MKLNIAILLTAIFQGLIFLPLGRGAVPMIALEVLGIQNIFSGDFSLAGGGGDYEASLPLSILLSLIGHVFLFIALFSKDGINKIYFSWIGIVALTISIINIFIHADFIWDIIFLFSLPFLVTEIWLIFLTVRRYKQVKYNASSSMWD